MLPAIFIETEKLNLYIKTTVIIDIFYLLYSTSWAKFKQLLCITFRTKKKKIKDKKFFMSQMYMSIDKKIKLINSRKNFSIIYLL